MFLNNSIRLGSARCTVSRSAPAARRPTTSPVSWKERCPSCTFRFTLNPTYPPRKVRPSGGAFRLISLSAEEGASPDRPCRSNIRLINGRRNPLVVPSVWTSTLSRKVGPSGGAFPLRLPSQGRRDVGACLPAAVCSAGKVRFSDCAFHVNIRYSKGRSDHRLRWVVAALS